MRACPSCLSVYFTDAEFCGLDGVRLIEAETDPLVGKIIGKYRLEELIGTGASGLVYRASTLDTPGQRLALKLLYGEMACESPRGRALQERSGDREPHAPREHR